MLPVSSDWMTPSRPCSASSFSGTPDRRISAPRASLRARGDGHLLEHAQELVGRRRGQGHWRSRGGPVSPGIEGRFEPTTASNASRRRSGRAGGANQGLRSTSQSTSNTIRQLATLATMLDALAIPPRLILRALDDLQRRRLLRWLTDSEGRSRRPLRGRQGAAPTEDELSANIALLREDIGALRAPLRRSSRASSLCPCGAAGPRRDRRGAGAAGMADLQGLLKKLLGI